MQPAQCEWGKFVRISTIMASTGRFTTIIIAVLAIQTISACATRNIGPNLQQAATVQQEFPSAIEERIVEDYLIGPFDTIDVQVFQEPDLTSENVQVDASGRVRLPLVGEVTASGKSAMDLSRELESLYGERYLVRPQITVNITSVVTQKVIVQGEVNSPGVYPIKGSASLLETFSLAGGETQLAALDKVVVLRTIDGQSMGAIFDVASIRRAEAPNPAIYASDVVIVGHSNARGLYRDLLAALPLINVFSPLYR